MSYDWKKIIIHPSDSILRAIEVIDKESLRAALVTEDDQLLGMVTDGDIRRGLLRNIPLEGPVSQVMNKEPKVVYEGASRSSILDLMETFDLLLIPILRGNKLVGVETLQHLTKRKKYDNPVFLMAGGFGTRLQPLTNSCPKPLLKVGEKPILETILDSFIEAGFHNFFISIHYMPEMIRDHFGDGSRWGVTIRYIHEDQPLGTGGALGLLPADINSLPIIVMNGDVLTKVDFVHLLKYHNEHESIATMCVKEYEYQVPYGVITTENHKILSMVEKPIQKFFVNAGIYVINSEVATGVEPNQNIDMPTLLDNYIKNDHTVSVFPVHEYWLDIGKMNDFKLAQQNYK
ncbi:mannose-1-phosphate guanyltransferase [Oleiphilus messinensis]|uniref:Mannose-1-phosphate guanyltransferase n=1 Tax=Oleiphilus messinensis TaxID=141451 RepID=A0A1Y0II75_9GAMM|nr:nucleotidyltransferase family protein [Oleiphilus messinensis]ARU59556.1 mannose-1-phosphate guanyltransferase [Oleiphilus messinensis]